MSYLNLDDRYPAQKGDFILQGLGEDIGARRLAQSHVPRRHGQHDKIRLRLRHDRLEGQRGQDFVDVDFFDDPLLHHVMLGPGIGNNDRDRRIFSVV
ncbi:MAG: hypothetical protein R2940_09050 [Syntrophotaleaceae bacterium]